MKASDLKKILDAIDYEDDDVPIVIKLSTGLSSIPDISIKQIDIYDCKIVITPIVDLTLDINK